MSIEISASEGDTAVRLDTFLSRHLPNVGRRRASELVALGAVRLNGRRARKGQLVRPNDVVRVDHTSLVEAARPLPEAHLPLKVLYEDEALIAVDKPAGIPVHPLRPGELGTAANLLVARYPELNSVGNHPLEAGLVHRLDTGTSGVLLTARTPESHRQLRRMFASREVVKLYLAIVMGDLKCGGLIKTPIAHAPHNRRRMCVCNNAERTQTLKARTAFTAYRPLRRFGSATLVAVRMRTGVRHQIRVHLASIGHPLLGDALYAPVDPEDLIQVCRPLLHASRVRLRHPQSMHLLVITAPLPKDFADSIRDLSRAGGGGHGGGTPSLERSSV